MEREAARLRLRPFTASDRDAIHAVYADAGVMRYVGHGEHRTTAEMTHAMRGYADSRPRAGTGSSRSSSGFVAVVERATGVLIGETLDGTRGAWRTL